MSEGTVHDWVQTGALMAAGLWTLLEYRKGQAWKRAEFAAELTKEFFASEGVRAAQRILWSDPRIPLLPGKAQAVSDADIVAALGDFQGSAQPDEAQTAIRHSFDSLLSRLERMEQHVRNRLLELSDLTTYIRYTCELLLGKQGRPARGPAVQQAIADYESSHGFRGALAFARQVCDAPER